MMGHLLQQRLRRQLHFRFLIKWLFVSLLVGAIVGSASAVFLIVLDYVTNYREAHRQIIWWLPAAGLIVAALYHYFGQDVIKGNNQLLEEIERPQNIVPLKMAPLVLLGTLITHLFGGSAGREGTAVQMGGAIADQFTRLFRFHKRDRSMLLVCGISAGFASVFGTPLAGTVFALEVMVIGRMRYDALIPSLLSALVANYACMCWPVHHTHYDAGFIPSFSMAGMLWAMLAGILFGWASVAFSTGMHYCSNLFRRIIKHSLLRPVAGGIVIVIFVFASGSTKYIGLGVPAIVASFHEQQEWFVFLIKMLLTVLTLSAGFKGGEVTPLFFIGATLGSFLSLFIPLPVGLLAGMGFVAVFSGAANTPLACVLMGIELFGADTGVYIAIACFMAYFFSGHTGIYTSQTIGAPKHPLFIRQQSKKLGDF
jgi:H+/Cl- antiporter ClcA